MLPPWPPGALNSTGLTRVDGVATSKTAVANAWGGSNWGTTSANGISGNKFVTFGFTISTGYVASLASVGMNYRRNANGLASGYWQHQLNGGSWSLIVGNFANEFSSTAAAGRSHQFRFR